MKKILIGISVTMLSFLAIYLMAAFTNAKIDFREWDKTSRGLTGVFGGMVSVFIGFVTSNKNMFS